MRRAALLALALVVVPACKKTTADADGGAPAASGSVATPVDLCKHALALDKAERAAKGKELDADEADRRMHACRARFESYASDPQFPCMARCMMDTSDLRVFNHCDKDCGLVRH
jgi:hypothetical protein